MATSSATTVAIVTSPPRSRNPRARPGGVSTSAAVAAPGVVVAVSGLVSVPVEATVGRPPHPVTRTGLLGRASSTFLPESRMPSYCLLTPGVNPLCATVDIDGTGLWITLTI